MARTMRKKKFHMTLLKGNKASQNTQGKGVVFCKTKNQPKDRQTL
jgi:hypothetical protein